MKRVLLLPLLLVSLPLGHAMLHFKWPSKDEVQCLSWTIFEESRGEPRLGQLAVGHVVLNRAKRLGEGVCEVIAHPRQFSFWSRNKPVRTSPVSDEIALSLLMEEQRGARYDFLHGITHYARLDVHKVWMKGFEIEQSIGSHKFLREKQ